MSQNDQNWQNDPAAWDDHGSPQPQGPNVLGIVGFIFAFCLPPIGLLLSLIALTRRPRGFAIAGTIIGLILSLILAGCAIGAAVFWDGLRMSVAMGSIPQSIDQYNFTQGAFPDSLSQLTLPDIFLTDAWGTDFRLDLNDDANTWRLISAGPDKLFDTPDDIIITSDMSDAEIQTTAQEAMQTWMETR